jgi:hypothetical protein
MDADAVTPVLLPGRSARYWQGVIRRVSIAALALWPVAIVLMVLTFALKLPFWGFLVPLAVGTIVSMAVRVTLLTGIPREKAEVAAGYTTLDGAHINLIQLDPENGEVVRRAGQPYLVIRRSRKSHPDTEAGPATAGPVRQFAGVYKRQTVSIPTRRPSVLRRVLPILVGTLLAMVTATVVTSVGKPSSLQLGLIGPAVLLAIFAIVLAIVATPRRRTLAALQESAPGAIVFTLVEAPEFIDAINRLDTHFPATRSADAPVAPVRQPYAATADLRGITRWADTPRRAFRTIAWKDITSITRGITSAGSASYGAVLVTIGVEPNPVTLPLPQPNGGSLTLASSAETGWVLAELTRLKSDSRE